MPMCRVAASPYPAYDFVGPCKRSAAGHAVFFSIPPRCLFLFTYPRAMLNPNSFNGFMIDVGIKEKQRQTA